MQQRWLLSILFAVALIFYALPRLPFSEGLPRIFSILWLSFALMAIGGNLAAYLYAEPKRRQADTEREISNLGKRQYER